MRRINRWCRYGSVFTLLVAGGMSARSQEAPPPAGPSELPVVIEAEVITADPKAPPAAAPADGQPGADCETCKSWTANVPVVDKFPPLGLLIDQPEGCGYYSLEDLLRDNCRQAPPKYPYPRFGGIAWSFFNARSPRTISSRGMCTITSSTERSARAVMPESARSTSGQIVPSRESAPSAGAGLGDPSSDVIGRLPTVLP